MKRLIISPLAENDLEAIWLYGAREWGRRRASLYLNDLRQRIEALAKWDKAGQPCDEIREGYRKLICGSHLVLYLSAEEHIDVKRVLHQSMDFTRHL